ncbi:Protein-methionine-sulfoxide reductase catalytic subunit MsrP [hydrothermal vent metagenome]|uniref:Protein-methionine-sulfoxide reductase catalytic subunit MsrP n=1 Tax=hydrothermal vent metagenome TaxID=652676 RepID=A0A3B1AG78_9ZZZZ
MLIKKSHDIKSSEITPQSIYENRRQFMRSAGGLLLATTASSFISPPLLAAENAKYGGTALDVKTRKNLADSEELTPFSKVSTYNNYYEFGTDKYSPAKLASSLKTDPWNVDVSGHVKNSGSYHLEDILKHNDLEERIYRFRCVETWSMVVPWVGFPLANFIKRMQPTSKAKYIKFSTLFAPENMPGQKRRVLQWPYVEGLTMDEAMHPLTMLVTGLYGESLPNQNGAPLRLIVPWKYGFKSIKSIAKIEFVEQQPVSSWTKSAPREYGFYSNVNPAVRHPRWSQAKERRLGDFFKRKSLMFNGYQDQVASLYTGLDLTKYF